LKALVELSDVCLSLKNTDFERMKPEKSESSTKICRNWITNWLKFQRIKISDLQNSILPPDRCPDAGAFILFFLWWTIRGSMSLFLLFYF